MNSGFNSLRDVVTKNAIPNLNKKARYTINFKRGFYDDVENNILTKDSMKALIKIASEYDLMGELMCKDNEKYEISLYPKAL